MKAFTPIIAILAIVGLELVAIGHGIDGKCLAITLMLIAGIGGYHLPGLKDRLIQIINDIFGGTPTGGTT